MKKIIDVIEENPFNSDYFFWMDCHFTRGILNMSFLEQEEDYLKMYNNVKNKNGDKFLLFNNAARPYGFFWGGSKTAIKNVYEKYFKLYFQVNTFLCVKKRFTYCAYFSFFRGVRHFLLADVLSQPKKYWKKLNILLIEYRRSDWSSLLTLE